ncbi:MAG: VWA domain-containing protein [Saprospiraceae bacterium]
MAYAEPLVQQPRDTIVILLSDLFEGGNVKEMFQRITYLHASGVQFISLLALNDDGAPAYDHAHAQRLADMGIPACVYA